MKEKNQNQIEALGVKHDVADLVDEFYCLRLLRHHKLRQQKILAAIDSKKPKDADPELFYQKEQSEIEQQVCVLDDQISQIEGSLKAAGFEMETGPFSQKRKEYDLEVQLSQIEDKLSDIMGVSSFDSEDWSLYQEEYNRLFRQYADCIDQMDILREETKR